MKYGITEEAKARGAYSKATANKVKTTGLWVNKKFPFLAPSPDGVAKNPGNNNSGKSRLTEIKCLKFLREISVEEFIQQCNESKIASVVLNRQCTIIKCSCYL